VVKAVTGAMLSRREMMGTLTTTSGCSAKMLKPTRHDHQRKPSSVSNHHTMSTDTKCNVRFVTW